MIEPMIRYDLLLYHGDVKPFMEKLRELGMVDITLRDWDAPQQVRDLMAQSDRYRTVWQRLDSIKPAEAGDGQSTEAPFDTVAQAVEAYEAAAERIDQLETMRAKATAELDELAMWGEFDPDEIKRLREQDGIALRFFEVATKQYNSEWERDYAIQVIAQTAGGETYFVVAQPTPVGTLPEPLDLGSAVVELKAPEMSFSQKEAQIEGYLKEEAEQQATVARAALSRDAIWADYLKMKDQVMFDDAVNAGESFADGTIKIVEAWSVVPNRQQVEAFLDAEGVIYESAQAKAEENPPIKLKNHFFARLFEPIGSLYMLPKYNELDMTPFFAPFFMLFFGLCFGDGGYGLLVVLACALMKRKVDAEYRPYLSLFQYLGLAAIIVGTCTGSFFGIALVDVPAFAAVKDYFVSSDNLMTFSIVIGLVQIIFGKCVAAYKTKLQKGFKYSVAPFAWVFVIVALAVALGLPALNMRLPDSVTTVCFGIAAVGLVVAYLYNSPGKNVFLNFGTGLWNTYNMASGLLGDTLSYIRLFAIGLTGSILGGVFNTLAISMTEGMNIVLRLICMAIILLLGHAINFGLCTISSLVHPLRLIFVEYYKNAEFEGGGKAYTPFKKA